MRLVFPLVFVLLAPLAAVAAKDPRVVCLRASGDVTTTCLDGFMAAPSDDEPPVLGTIEGPVRAACSEDAAWSLGYLGLDDEVLRLRDACQDFGLALLTLARATPPPADGSPEARCQRIVTAELDRLRTKTIALFGKACFLRETAGKHCRRPARDRKATALQARARAAPERRCGTGFAALGLGTVDDTVAAVFDRSRHFAQLVYPPNDLGPSAEFGPYPVGVRTLMLEDPSRQNADATGPRPVTTEVWYPSTAEGVAGMPRYVVNLFGIDIAKTPTFRDVTRAPGPFPLVLFSHANTGIRFQSLFLAVQLASHGFVVASPDHYGNTFLDFGLESIAASALNRPRDMSFVLDRLLAFNADPGSFFAAAVDPARIGMSGHSFGGYTTLALAGGTILGTTFTDARVRAFLPLAPASSLFPDTFFPTITAPILIAGGTLDTTTPFASEQRRAFDLLPSGAAVVGLAEITGAGHYTFSDVCEVPRSLVAAIGGFDEACTPAHLPWRQAHDVIAYLATNFFDATLNGSGEARARLDPATLAKIDDLVYDAK